MQAPAHRHENPERDSLLSDLAAPSALHPPVRFPREYLEPSPVAIFGDALSPYVYAFIQASAVGDEVRTMAAVTELCQRIDGALERLREAFPKWVGEIAADIEGILNAAHVPADIDQRYAGIIKLLPYLAGPKFISAHQSENNNGDNLVAYLNRNSASVSVLLFPAKPARSTKTSEVYRLRACNVPVDVSEFWCALHERFTEGIAPAVQFAGKSKIGTARNFRKISISELYLEAANSLVHATGHPQRTFWRDALVHENDDPRKQLDAIFSARHSFAHERQMPNLDELQSAYRYVRYLPRELEHEELIALSTIERFMGASCADILAVAAHHQLKLLNRELGGVSLLEAELRETVHPLDWRQE